MNDLNSNYYTYDDNGKYVHVLPMDACLESLRVRLIDQAGIIEAQKKIISEHEQKDNDNVIIEKLNKEISDLQKRLSSAFEISGYNWKKIHKWQAEHDKDHGTYPTAGERYTYEFLPSGIVTGVTCRCMLCNEKFDVWED